MEICPIGFRNNNNNIIFDGPQDEGTECDVKCRVKKNMVLLLSGIPTNMAT